MRVALSSPERSHEVRKHSLVDVRIKATVVLPCVGSPDIPTEWRLPYPCPKAADTHEQRFAFGHAKPLHIEN